MKCWNCGRETDYWLCEACGLEQASCNDCGKVCGGTLVGPDDEVYCETCFDKHCEEE